MPGALTTEGPALLEPSHHCDRPPTEVHMDLMDLAVGGLGVVSSNVATAPVDVLCLPRLVELCPVCAACVSGRGDLLEASGRGDLLEASGRGDLLDMLGTLLEASICECPGDCLDAWACALCRLDSPCESLGALLACVRLVSWPRALCRLVASPRSVRLDRGARESVPRSVA